ncbi:MAG TPA: site-specific integrase [Candidatus Paceibacterota bacterium]|nr:site-specific integrase [Candidatus Paceibacterota bacterium]
MQDMILTALRTGMRQGELRGLQWSSIHWENRTVTVRHSLNDRTKELESPKSNRERHIPIDIDVYGVLFRRRKDTGYVFSDGDGKPFDSQYIIRRLDEIRSRAGLRKFTWHSLRHTFASQLAMKGAPLHAVQALLGHSSISTTMRYAHVAPSSLRTAVDMLNPKTAMHTAFGQPAGNQWSQATQQEIEKPYAATQNL